MTVIHSHDCNPFRDDDYEPCKQCGEEWAQLPPDGICPDCKSKK